MKRIVLLIPILFLAACSSLQNSKKSYNGTWILQQQSGGFAGRTIKPEKEIKLVIKNGKITRFEDNQLISQEDFKIEKGKLIHSSELQDIIISKKLMKEAISVKGDSLIISQQCYDCYSFLYTRK